MSHQRYLSHDPIKEPHSVSVKVLRLSCPSLVPQYPIEPPFKPSTTTTAAAAAAAAASPLPASLAYHPSSTNPSPFLLSPILNLPVSFGSAYVGETFSCTLCANNDLDDSSNTATTKRQIRDVRVEAEMKTPGQAKAQSLELGPAPSSQESAAGAAAAAATDLAPGGTLQKIVSFDLKEEGNHVLAVTPGEVEQVCFVVETRRGGNEEEEEDVDVVARARAAGGPDARVVFGVLGIGWRGEMGNRGFLSTGKLGTRVVR
ncbi:Trafficking protein particle complex subunit 13 [Beauveria bassiana]|uniref:Trafficking protein particle complex subunit 13 n=1 Tax=Beauveria bassiana TaxID=176275 RepID=A0A2N6P1B1_BEABA|nr:Trafficking protein particle complex subunit 13 [Beauveria bassiana]